MRPRKTTAPAISRKVRRLFDAICSYTSAGEAHLPGGLRLIRHRGGVDRTGTRVRDLLEQLALVGGVAADGLHQVRDQVVAAAELDVDLRPAVVDAVAERDEPGEAQDAGE